MTMSARIFSATRTPDENDLMHEAISGGSSRQRSFRRMDCGETFQLVLRLELSSVCFLCGGWHCDCHLSGK